MKVFQKTLLSLVLMIIRLLEECGFVGCKAVQFGSEGTECLHLLP